MKKAGILNSDIARVLACLGHTDTICISDCGLPVPKDVERIDLALAFGDPTVLHTLKVVMDDMEVEKVVLAEEMKVHNANLCAQLEELFGEKKIAIEFVPIGEFKKQTCNCKAIVRTGETTPYANVILQAGCSFA